jgi:hypothetical protein
VDDEQLEGDRDGAGSERGHQDRERRLTPRIVKQLDFLLFRWREEESPVSDFSLINYLSDANILSGINGAGQKHYRINNFALVIYM